MKTTIHINLILVLLFFSAFQKVNAQSGNCLVFDGVDDYVSTEYTPSTNNFSISGWVYIDSQTGTDVIAGTCSSEWTGYWLQIYNGKLSFRHGAADIQGTTVIPIHNWTHVALSYNGSAVKGYVNGVLEFNQTLSVTNTGGSLYVGAIGALLYGITFFDGQLDNIAYWGYDRTQGEFQTEISNGLTGDEYLMKAFFPFNQGKPNDDNTSLVPQAVNRTNCYHGTLHNFSMNAVNSNWMYTSIAKEPVISNIECYPLTNSVIATANIFMAGSVNPHYRGFKVAEDECFTSGVQTEQESGSFNAGEYTLEIDNLDPNTTYYVRPYATNTEGTSYGEIIEFKTRLEAPGNALNFDGSSDYVSSDLPPVFQNLYNNSVTIEAIVKPVGGEFQRIIAAQHNSDNYATISIGVDNKIYVNLNVFDTEYSASSTSAINPSFYTHIAVSFNSSTHEISIYKNGELQSNAAGTMPGLNYDGFFIIGSDGNSSYYYEGTIDEVRVWDYVRDICDIQSTMNTELIGTEDGLQLYYNFNHGTAGGNNSGETTVNDYSGNSLHGTLNTFGLTGTSSNWITSSASLSGINVLQDVSEPVPDVENLLEVSDDCQVTLSAPTATDECQGTISGTTTTVFPIEETTTVTWTYDDGFGNIVNQDQLVTITDTEAPDVTCPGDIVIDLEQGQIFYSVSDGSLNPVSVDDNCTVYETLNDYNDAATLDLVEFTSGVYAITWTSVDIVGNEGECSFNLTVNGSAGIDEFSSDGVSIYPNPVCNKVTVCISDTENNSHLVLIDISGKVLLEMTGLQQTETLDLSRFDKGMYFIRIENQNFVKTTKIVIE